MKMKVSWGGFGFGIWRNEKLWTIAVGFCCLYIFRGATWHADKMV